MKYIKYLAFGLAVTAALTWVSHAADVKVKPYPLKVCLITGEKLGTDGMSVYTITNKNQEIKFCCQGCEKTFNKNPEKYLKKLKEEVAKLEKESKK